MQGARTSKIVIPYYYKPRPHQILSWQRKNSGKYHYYVDLWARQLGKDTNDLQWGMRRAWDYPGSSTAYIGLDNVWIAENIFKKTIEDEDGVIRKHWANYPEDKLDIKDTQREVIFKNNTGDSAEARIKFIGFLNDQQLIGSSYDTFIISEGSLYKRNAFQYIEPIWDSKISNNKPFIVAMNGTPRGMKNVYYDFIRAHTGVDDPEDFPGEHGDCYIDKVTIHDAMVPDPEHPGMFKKQYTPELIEKIQDRYMRQFGNLNLFKQEYECDFTTVNAGLVYQGIELLEKENRYCPYNLDTSRPVYAAFDIASKGKETDATAGIIFQYYNGKMFIFDIFEDRGKSFVDCFSQVFARGYGQYIRFVALPWDSERSASSETPIEEARRIWPNVNWHSLDKERVDRGIDQVRRMLPNMVINSGKCNELMEAFNSYEYKFKESTGDWTAKPVHNKSSHLMDALRYAVMSVNEIKYLGLNAEGGSVPIPSGYSWFEEEKKPEPSIWGKKVTKHESGLYW